ncbi:MAG: hypothetical protein QOI80_374 [Solirubrobacteraceae bacterium]|jgi:hypothetical protein|nr:hypothetical protein [Solirubrobacteraceae bacterium]
MALVQGWADTRAALREWSVRPGQVLRPWSRWSLCVAVLLLLATWAVAKLSVPDTFALPFAGVTGPADLGDYAFVLFRNSLVLALHALACVAGFIAGSSLPKIAGGYSGFYRKLHEVAQPLAIAFVVCATLFSLCTQAYILGHDASTLAAQWHMSPAELLAILSLHAVPELTALFLPLAAWTMASRRGEWEHLLAATFATVAVAVPVLLLAAAIEVWVTPRILLAVIG